MVRSTPRLPLLLVLVLLLALGSWWKSHLPDGSTEMATSAVAPPPAAAAGPARTLPPPPPQHDRAQGTADPFDPPVDLVAPHDALALHLLAALHAGQPLRLSLPGAPERLIAFRPAPLLTPDFRASLGPDAAIELPASTWHGRLLGGPDGARPTATLTVAGPAVILRIDEAAGALFVRRDPVSGQFRAGREGLPAGAEALAESGPANTVPATLLDRLLGAADSPRCNLSPPDKTGTRRVASTAVPAGSTHHFDIDLPWLAQLAPAPLDPTGPQAAVAGEAITTLDSETVIPFGPAYDASLRDLTLLLVLDKATTGASVDPAVLAARAADYINLTATIAAVYEEQLGLRLRLQEIVLHPNTPAYTDPGQDLIAFEDWTLAHRPFEVYRWSHAARFGIVADSPGGIIGRAYLGYAGTPYGLSENETSYGFTLFAHELGHSVGSEHTTGGVMNPTLIGNQRNFFRLAEGTSVTGAKQISDTMREPSLSYGTAAVRDAAEIPFGADDFVATAAQTPVAFAPLANDFAAVPQGAVNTLRLVEIGAVFPRHAGSVLREADTLTFTPAAEFTGVAWFSYTLGGDVGNAGSGWLHRADVQVTVGGDSTLPVRPPGLALPDLTLAYDPALPTFTFNPLLEATGAGLRWAGDVSRVLGPNGSDQAWGGTSLALVGASLVAGPGSIARVALPMTVDSLPQLRPAGDLVFTPPAGGTTEASAIEVTVRDASGAEVTATVTLTAGSFVNVFATAAAREEGAIPGRFVFVPTHPPDTPLTIAFRLAGDAVADTHFTVSGAATFDTATATGTIVVPAQGDQTELLILPIGDGVAGPDRQVVLRLDERATDWAAGVPGAFPVARLPVLDGSRLPSLTAIFPGGAKPFALAHRQLSFVPHRSRGYRTFIHPEPVTAFPVDPAGGTVLALGDDAAAAVPFAGGRAFPFAGELHDQVWVGSNGYVTFGVADTYMVESAARHFDRRRISVLFDDLDPSAGGTVSYRQLEDRWVLTVEEVPEWSLPNRSSYQLELFWDGCIRMTWLQVDTGEALVGISSGGGVPSPFVEDDFLWALPRQGLPGLLASTVNGGAVEGGEAALLALTLRDPASAPVTLAWDSPSELQPLTTTLAFASGDPVAVHTTVAALAGASTLPQPAVTPRLASSDLGYDDLLLLPIDLAVSPPSAFAVAVSQPDSHAVGLPTAGLGLDLSATAPGASDPSWEWEVLVAPPGQDGNTGAFAALAATELAFPTAGTWWLRATAEAESGRAAALLAVHVGGAAIAAADGGFPVAPHLAAVPPTSIVAGLPFSIEPDLGGGTDPAWSIRAAPAHASDPAILSPLSAGAVEATLPVAGPWTLRLSASGAAAIRVWLELPVSAWIPTLESWRQTAFAALPGGADDPLAAATADPDGDGIPNLLEYALGLDPLDAGSELDSVLQLEVDPADLLSLRFRRHLGDATGNLLDGYTVNAITYRVEVSEDLSTWRSGSAYLEVVGPGVDAGDGTEWVEVRSRTPVSVAPQYLRLRVQ